MLHLLGESRAKEKGSICKWQDLRMEDCKQLPAQLELCKELMMKLFSTAKNGMSLERPYSTMSLRKVN